jgi:hypothetical protein
VDLQWSNESFRSRDPGHRNYGSCGFWAWFSEQRLEMIEMGTRPEDRNSDLAKTRARGFGSRASGKQDRSRSANGLRGFAKRSRGKKPAVAEWMFGVEKQHVGATDETPVLKTVIEQEHVDAPAQENVPRVLRAIFSHADRDPGQ